MEIKRFDNIDLAGNLNSTDLCIDHCFQTKKNLDCYIETTIILIQTVGLIQLVQQVLSIMNNFLRSPRKTCTLHMHMHIAQPISLSNLNALLQKQPLRRKYSILLKLSIAFFGIVNFPFLLILFIFKDLFSIGKFCVLRFSVSIFFSMTDTFYISLFHP